MTLERFLRLVDKIQPDHNDCKVWAGNVTSRGYPRVYLNDGSKQKRTGNRIILETKLGRPIRIGMLACHHCDVKRCLSSDHIYEGTPKQNAQDAIRNGKFPLGRKNGSRLHPEKVPRGDKHGSRLHPESRARGNRHGTHVHPESVSKGEEHGMVKLSEEKIQQIKEFYSTGFFTQENLARRYGVGQTAISKIVRGATWRHVR